MKYLILLIFCLSCTELPSEKSPLDYSGEKFIKIRESCQTLAKYLKSNGSSLEFDSSSGYICIVFNKKRNMPIAIYESELKAYNRIMLIKQDNK